jgi:peptidoglycan/LPS O-acetylase OafA/YrhL
MQANIDEGLLRPSANNFTLVRLVLASSVIYTHAYWATTGVEGRDEISPFLGASVGECAVEGFFFLSGFLVYMSLQRLRNSRSFLVARFLRLWPGLAVAVITTALAGWFVTTAPGLGYLRGDTARFVFGNLSFVRGYYALTGVFCDGQLCDVNGSLWTLPWEVRCYLLLAALGLLGLAGKTPMARFVLPATLVFALVWDFGSVRSQTTSLLGQGPAFDIDIFHRLWFPFALGAAAYLSRQRIRLNWLVLIGLMVANYAFQGAIVAAQVRALAIGYAVLCAGLLTARRTVVSGRWPDYSYGAYIYAFPVMDLVHALWPTPSHLALAAVTFVATIPIAAVSWHFVEKPCLNLIRNRRVRSPQPPAEASGPIDRGPQVDAATPQGRAAPPN